MSLFSQIEKLSDIKIKRQALLLDIRAQISGYDFVIDFDSFADKISDKVNVSYKTRGYLIQLLSKIIQFHPNFKDRGLKLVKRVLDDEEKELNNKHREEEKKELLSENLVLEEKTNLERIFIIKSILFFYFIVDYKILLSLNISEDEDELLHVRNRFLFVDYSNIDRKFEIPEYDIVGYNNRIVNFDRLQNNVKDSLKLSKFKLFSDFILFTAEFPFLNRLNFVKRWTGFDNNKKNDNDSIEEKSIFFKTMLDSQLFIHDENFIIYDPQERVKVDKFVNSREERLKIPSEINNRIDFNRKKKLLSSFISNYIKTSEYIDTDRGIILQGFDGQIITNKYFNKLLKLELNQTSANINSEKKLLRDFVSELISEHIVKTKTVPMLLLLNGKCFEVKISDLVIGPNEHIGNLIIFSCATEKILLENSIYHSNNSYIFNLNDTEKFKMLDFIYRNNIDEKYESNHKNMVPSEVDKTIIYPLLRKAVNFYKKDFLKYNTEISFDLSSFEFDQSKMKAKKVTSNDWGEDVKSLYEAVKIIFHVIINYSRLDTIKDIKDKLTFIVSDNNKTTTVKIVLSPTVKLIRKSYYKGLIVSLNDSNYMYDSFLNLIYLNSYFKKVFGTNFIVKEEFEINNNNDNINNKSIGTCFQFEVWSGARKIMKIVLQRVNRAEVIVKEKVVGKISIGLLLFLGITHDDTENEIKYLVDKISNLRIFEDENGKMNKSVLDIANGEILVVSQFTLYGDTRKGRRPGFDKAAKPNIADELYEKFIEIMKKNTNLKVEAGIFGATMEVNLNNDGPVTFILEKDAEKKYVLCCS